MGIGCGADVVGAGGELSWGVGGFDSAGTAATAISGLGDCASTGISGICSCAISSSRSSSTCSSGFCGAASDWCQVQVGDYRGYLRRSQFWGTLPGEAVN